MIEENFVKVPAVVREGADFFCGRNRHVISRHTVFRHYHSSFQIGRIGGKPQMHGVGIDAKIRTVAYHNESVYCRMFFQPVIKTGLVGRADGIFLKDGKPAGKRQPDSPLPFKQCGG